MNETSQLNRTPSSAKWPRIVAQFADRIRRARGFDKFPAYDQAKVALRDFCADAAEYEQARAALVAEAGL